MVAPVSSTSNARRPDVPRSNPRNTRISLRSSSTHVSVNARCRQIDKSDARFGTSLCPERGCNRPPVRSENPTGHDRPDARSTDLRMHRARQSSWAWVSQKFIHQIVPLDVRRVAEPLMSSKNGKSVSFAVMAAANRLTPATACPTPWRGSPMHHRQHPT